MNAAAAVAAPRLHNQWLPDGVRVENGFSADALETLRTRGHNVLTPLPQTSANSIAITPGGLAGAPDPRTRGAFAAGH
jgi:gamma-glutamyltranspeptidase/glutathione hydrolase